MRTRKRIPAAILSVLKDATATAAHWTIPARPSVSTVRQQNVNIIPIINAMRKPFLFRADMQGKADRRFAELLNVNVDKRGMPWGVPFYIKGLIIILSCFFGIVYLLKMNYNCAINLEFKEETLWLILGKKYHCPIMRII